MALTKVVNGKRMPVPAAEEAAIRAEWEASASAPESVPSEISKLKLVQELRARQLWGPFKAALAQSMTDREDWELANVIERYHPRTEQMGAAFGLDGAGLDDLFRKAAAR